MPTRKEADEGEIVTMDDLMTPTGPEDIPSAGHLVLRQQRKVLYYLRLIDHDLPKLFGM